MIKIIDISGGFPLTLHGGWDRATMAASVAVAFLGRRR